MVISRRAFTFASALSLAAPALARNAAIMDASGREIKPPPRVERVFPAGPPAAIQQYVIDPQALLGWPRANRPPERVYLLPDIGARPEVGRLTGRGNTTNLETLIALRPDLIIDIGSTTRPFAETAQRVQQQTGIPYALLDGRFDQLLNTIKLHAQLIGQDEKGQLYARLAGDILSTARARVDSVPLAERPKIYYARGPKGLETALGGSINFEIMDFMGAHNVAGATQGGLSLVSLEQVLFWNPDIIITIDRDFAEQVRQNPDWRAVKAVQRDQIYLAPKMPFGWIDFPPALNRLPGLFWLGKIFYPKLFPENLTTLTRDFYSNFYHRTPSDADIENVLAGRI